MPFGRVITPSSEAGVRWQQAIGAPVELWQAVNWNEDNQRWCAPSTSIGTTSMISPDGLTWALSATPIPLGLWRDLDSSSDLGQMIAVSASNTAQFSVSTDGGDNWGAATAPFGAINGFNAIKWAGALSLWIASTSQAGAQGIATSPDGNNWTLRNAPNTGSAHVQGCIAFSPTIPRAVVGYADGTIIHSDDGITWNTASAPVAGVMLADVEWVPELDLFVGVGQAAGGGASLVALTSPDGDVWTSRALPQSAVWTSLAHASSVGRIIAVNNNVSLANGGSRFASTEDGINWRSEYGPTLDYIAIGANPNSFVTVTPTNPSFQSGVVFSS